MKVYIETLGCKVNFADSAGLAAILANNGYMVTTDPHDAELFIINSCSVTHRAERECRQLARRFHSFNPSAKIIITGCSALSETFRKRADDIPFSHLISTDNILSELNLERREDAVHYYNRSRPFIKIQEGCDRFCSYCIVPYLRGKPRSISRRTILSQIHDALKNGFQEIVLVGTHIMLYEEPDSKTDIFALLKDIEQTDGDFRIRLSSVEPYGLTAEKIVRLSEIKRLCSHFHIPLQSGSDRVLRDMKRDYKVSDFKRIVETIIEKIPDATIGTDIITGFPTETESDFGETEKFLMSVPLGYLHVFRYSQRKGTPAAEMISAASHSEIKKRSEILLKISFDKRREMLKKYIGRAMDILITDGPEKISGLTHNYIRVIVKNGKALKGRLYRARLIALNENNTISGELL